MRRESATGFVLLNVALVAVCLLAISLAFWDWTAWAGRPFAADASEPDARAPASVDLDGLWTAALSGGFGDSCTADMGFIYPIGFNYFIGNGTFQCQGGASGSLQGTFTEVAAGHEADITLSPDGQPDINVEGSGQLSPGGDWFDADWYATGLGLSGTSTGLIEGAMPAVHFTGTVVTIGEDPGPDGWWNVGVTEVISGPPLPDTVDVYGVDRFGCYGSFEIPHDGSSIGRFVEVLGYYDAPYEVLPCDFPYYIRYTTEPTPTQSPAPALVQGDVNCDGNVDALDAVQYVRHLAGLTVSQQPGCPGIGTEVASLFGDADCANGLDTNDLLQVLRHAGALPVVQYPECTPIGEPLS